MGFGGSGFSTAENTRRVDSRYAISRQVTWHCGTTRVSGVQVALYRSSGKGKTRVHQRQDSRSHEFRKPDRRIKSGEVKSTRVSENRTIGVRSLVIQFVDVASSDFPIGRSSDSGGESTLTRIGLRGIVR
jgi:hypothetical protein